MSSRSPFAALPSVDRLANHPSLTGLIEEHGRALTLTAIRLVLADERQRLTATATAAPSASTLVDATRARLETLTLSKLRSVFNLTGTVLHTNLGRAQLPDEAIAAITRAAREPCALEYDLNDGRRGDRDEVVRELLCELTGAEDATVVNNNAAAVFLVLNTLAAKKEVLVSRGELIEIGGSFRIPDIMRRAGVKLVEVGTTNRTHRSDFAEAIGPRTAMLMKVHTSNFAITGFTHSALPNELAELARAHQLPFVEDLGSGTLTDFAALGLPPEPTPQQALAQGADLVTFSGDKLLGGPQAGLLVGRRDLIARVKKNPLKRILRVGKLTLAALEAILQLYRDPDRLSARLTTVALLTRPAGEIEALARRLVHAVGMALSAWPVTVEVVALESQLGSGALPTAHLPSAGLAIHAKRSATLKRVESALRALPRPVLGRVHHDTLLLDMRCLTADDESAFVAQLQALPPVLAG